MNLMNFSRHQKQHLRHLQYTWIEHWLIQIYAQTHGRIRSKDMNSNDLSTGTAWASGLGLKFYGAKNRNFFQKKQ